MWSIHRNSYKPFFLLVSLVSLATLLTFVLAACGGTGSGIGSTPTSTPTSVQGYGTAHGCPSDAIVTPTPPIANVTIKLSDTNAAVTAHVGDVLEIQLPFGLRWTNPTIARGELHVQTPAGYASTVLGMCIWRFKASRVGTTHLTFFARALCQAGQFCPQYVLAFPFTIVVK